MDVLSNLARLSREADVRRLAEHRRSIRSQIRNVRNIRQFAAAYDARYIGGAAQCEYGALAHLRGQWGDYRAFLSSMRRRRTDAR